jgi:hypothetical protein
MSCEFELVLRGRDGTYKNLVNSVDRIDRTEIISLFGFGSYYAFYNFGPHFSKTTQNFLTLNRPNQNDQID